MNNGVAAIWARIVAFGGDLPSENALLEQIEKRGGPRKSTLRQIKFGHVPTEETLDRIAVALDTTAIYLRYGYEFAREPENLNRIIREGESCQLGVSA